MEPFWASVKAFLALDRPDERFYAELFDEDDLQDIPSLSLDPFALENYDQRLEDNLRFWNPGGVECDATSPALPEFLSMDDTEDGSPALAAPTPSLEENDNESCSGVNAASEADTLEKGQSKAEDDTFDEDGIGEVGDNDYDEDVVEVEDHILGEDDISNVGDNDFDKDSVEVEDDILEEEYDSTEADKTSEDAGTVDLEWTLASQCNDTSAQHDTDASTQVTSSCRVCRAPDDEQMIACSDNVVHSDEEAWYHYQCVRLNKNNVPEGDWYCPRCRSEMQEDSRKSNAFSTKRTSDTSEQRSSTKQDTKGSKKQKKDQSSEAVKVPDQPKKSSKAWSDPEEKLRVLELLKEYQSDPSLKREVRYSEKKWEVVGTRLLERYGFDRSRHAIKCKFGRTIRAMANYDERDETHRNPNKMQTSVESPEARKQKRQANKASVSRRKRERERGSGTEDDEGEGNQAKEKGEPSQKKRRRKNSEEGEVAEEELPKQSYAQEYDFSSHKNKGKRKRDEEDDDPARPKVPRQGRSL